VDEVGEFGGPVDAPEVEEGLGEGAGLGLPAGFAALFGEAAAAGVASSPGKRIAPAKRWWTPVGDITASPCTRSGSPARSRDPLTQ